MADNLCKFFICDCTFSNFCFNIFSKNAKYEKQAIHELLFPYVRFQSATKDHDDVIFFVWLLLSFAAVIRVVTQRCVTKLWDHTKMFLTEAPGNETQVAQGSGNEIEANVVKSRPSFSAYSLTLTCDQVRREKKNDGTGLLAGYVIPRIFYLCTHPLTGDIVFPWSFRLPLVRKRSYKIMCGKQKNA